jgi:pilus assembly protein Flp/PilA
MTRALRRLWRSLVRDRKAATAIEYGLIAALIVVAMIASLSNLANITTGMWNNVNDKVNHPH